MPKKVAVVFLVTAAVIVAADKSCSLQITSAEEAEIATSFVDDLFAQLQSKGLEKSIVGWNSRGRTCVITVYIADTGRVEADEIKTIVEGQFNAVAQQYQHRGMNFKLDDFKIVPPDMIPKPGVGGSYIEQGEGIRTIR